MSTSLTRLLGHSLPTPGYHDFKHNSTNWKTAANYHAVNSSKEKLIYKHVNQRDSATVNSYGCIYELRCGGSTRFRPHYTAANVHLQKQDHHGWPSCIISIQIWQCGRSLVNRVTLGDAAQGMSLVFNVVYSWPSHRCRSLENASHTLARSSSGKPSLSKSCSPFAQHADAENYH